MMNLSQLVWDEMVVPMLDAGILSGWEQRVSLHGNTMFTTYTVYALDSSYLEEALNIVRAKQERLAGLTKAYNEKTEHEFLTDNDVPSLSLTKNGHFWQVKLSVFPEKYGEAYTGGISAETPWDKVAQDVEILVSTAIYSR